MPLRVAVINLTGGGASGGYRKYLHNVLPLLARHREIGSILCAAPPPLAIPSWFPPMDNVAFAECEPFRVIGASSRKLHRRLDEFAPDVVFVPLERHFAHRDVPCVCMLRNMLPLADMRHGTVRETIRNLMQKAMARRAVTRATRVIAVSRHVADYLETRWRLGPEKIGLVYHGVTVPPAEIPAAPAAVPAAWAGRFVLAPGTIEPYRELGDLLDAVARLRRDGHEVNVVLAGGVRPAVRNHARALHRLARDLGIEDRIRWTGHLDGSELAWCYANAGIVVATSRVEACPNTALEAMSHGCLIVSTDSPPMPEIFGSAACYYPAGDSAALASRLAEAIHGDSVTNDRKRKAAAERAASFSWARTVDGTVRELRRAVGRA